MKKTTINRVDVADSLKQQSDKLIKPHAAKRCEEKKINYNFYTVVYARFQHQRRIMDMVPPVQGLGNKILLKKNRREIWFGGLRKEIFSKLANVVRMKNKDGESVLTTCRENLKKVRFSMILCSDDAGAFKTVVDQFLKVKVINHIITVTHANLVDRFIRTIKICDARQG